MQYMQTRQQLLALLAQNQSRERILQAEIHALLIHLPPWAQAYFEDASAFASEKDFPQIVERVVYALEDQRGFFDVIAKIERNLREINQLRRDRSKLESMVRDRTLDLYEMQRYVALPDDVTREAKKILNKHKTSFVDYKDVLRYATVDPIEKIFDPVVEEEGKVVCVGLSHLSKRQREAYVLHEVEGLSYTQTAERLGVTKGSVAKYMDAARKKFEHPSVQLEFCFEP